MPTLQRCSDSELLHAARAGEAEAFACFYRRHRELLLGYLVRRARRGDIAMDLMAESFTAVLVAVHRDDFEDPDLPIAWLFAIARNKLIDAHRRGLVDERARREAGLQPLVLDDDDLQRIDSLTEEGRVLELLERLPADQREAVRAHIVDDRDYSEIANDTRTSQMVVRQRVSRGLRRLRKMLEAQA
ncbi:MAG TPA: sigma-70 family RNA polymerase sigma factor [Solirubrobacteraceae bacterium]|nr:sigma-70 family RNA polymerase sigma factor [Solirubrobacteraceae bacterium]